MQEEVTPEEIRENRTFIDEIMKTKVCCFVVLFVLHLLTWQESCVYLLKLKTPQLSLFDNDTIIYELP